MSRRRRQPTQPKVQKEVQEEVQNEEKPQLKQYILNNISIILHGLKNVIHNSILSSLKTAGQLLWYGCKSVFRAFLTIALMVGVMYLIWEYMVKRLIFVSVCQTFIGSIPIISKYCIILSKNNSGNSKTIVLPIESVVGKTVTLAEHLSETDVSTHTKITEVKISLNDLKANVLFSQIEQATKNELINGIDDVKDHAALTIDEIQKMLAICNGALSRLEIYTRNLQKVLTKKVDQNEIVTQFEAYLEDIESQIERVIRTADDVHLKLVNLGEKTGVLNTIASIPHQIDTKKLNEIESGNFLSKLYRMTIGKGNIEKVKYKRNIQVFDQFPNFTKSAVIKINNVINRLRTFKHEIDEIKYTVSKMDRGQTLQLDSHLEILNNGLELLQKYKKHLNGRIAENKKN